jgi:hypothetical protein
MNEGMVVLPVSEILPVRGVDFVGTISAEFQLDQVFAAAVVKGAKDPRGLQTPHRVSRVGKRNSNGREDGDGTPWIGGIEAMTSAPAEVDTYEGCHANRCISRTSWSNDEQHHHVRTD